MFGTATIRISATVRGEAELREKSERMMRVRPDNPGVTAIRSYRNRSTRPSAHTLRVTASRACTPAGSAPFPARPRNGADHEFPGGYDRRALNGDPRLIRKLRKARL